MLAKQASKETIHERYKDLAHVEWAFRTSKTGLLEARPFYVRLETRTRGHLLVVMLAYLLVQELATCWRELELTVEEGLEELKSLCTTRVTVKGQSVLHNVPEPRESVQRLLDAARVTLPKTIADRGVHVSTRKKLVDERQPRRKKQLAPANPRPNSGRSALSSSRRGRFSRFSPPPRRDLRANPTWSSSSAAITAGLTWAQGVQQDVRTPNLDSLAKVTHPSHERSTT